MNHEIERKFFFDADQWSLKPVKTEVLEQGYLSETGEWEARLRRSGIEYWFAMKSGSGIERGEWEIPLDKNEFDGLWPRTENRRLAKTRETYRWKGAMVEVDHYSGALAGLSVAEVEFETLRAAKTFEIPRSFGPELTYDPRYKNRALAAAPFSVPRLGPARGLSTGWSYGAVPFRKGSSGWEVVLVSTRRGDRWIFPKGQPENGWLPEKVALAEGREEAGVTGKIVGHPVVLPYSRDATTTNLLLFPVRVSDLADRWLEGQERERRVLSLAEAEKLGDLPRLGVQWLRSLLE